MPPRRNNLNWLLISLAAILIVLAFAARLTRRQTQPTDQAQVMPPQTQSNPVSSETVLAATVHAPDDSTRRLQEACEAMRTASGAQTARLRLTELRGALSAMPTNAAIAAIRQFLDSKTDAPTHLGFKVAGNGLLDEAPTFRTFLLDQLARLDPAAAADYAKVVLASMVSPDEWALALRDLARGGTSPAARTLLQQKTGEMLRYGPWQQNPSVGFLEAFDVAVYLGGTGLLPTLSHLVQNQDNPAVAHASFLALDRLVINDPATTLAALLATPDLMQGRELTRANFFARADVRDSQQRQVLESYLLDPQLSPAEVDTFAGIYPNANSMVSPNLLTQTPSPGHAALLSRDAESLRVVQQWLADPRFAQLRPQLEKMRARLEGFVQQVKTGNSAGP